MALSPGIRIGPYEIVGALGAGGMGEVYRARDARLDRDVAIKILPEAFALDPERLARFEREAKTLASLNHPHIAAIYGIEDGVAAGQARALVMELVEGDDLSQRLARGPMAVDEALPVARQIAAALEAAHQAGIIHRDLKPANIKVRSDGTVKVLDFGLAKALDPGSGLRAPGSGLANSATITSPAMTMRGMILGTAAYMAPEQAKGRAVDKRADLWAFGCVLFEMLTGRRPFEGDDVSEVMAAVIKSEPDWSVMPATVPSHIQLLIRKCLEKDPSKRIGDAAVARFLMDEPAAVSPTHQAQTAPRKWWPIAVGAFALAVAVAAAAWAAMSFTTAMPPAMRLAIVPAESAPFVNLASDRDIAVSPDGRHIVYKTFIGGTVKLVVRDLDQLEGRVLEGTELARAPFFSPDGQWVAFFAAGSLKKVAIAGGPPQTLCAEGDGGPRGGTWHGDTIVFATSGRGVGLRRVSAAGGSAAAVTTPDGAAGEFGHWFPSFLPDGHKVLYTIIPVPGPPAVMETAVVDLATGEHRRVIRGASQAQFAAPGAVVFADGTTLRAVAFDGGRAQPTGEPVPVIEGVSGSGGASEFAISRTGMLVYVAATATDGAPPGLTLVWVDRAGREETIPTAQRSFADPRISPNGQQVVVESADEADDIWTLDLGRGTLTRQTFEPGEDETAVWMRDGQTVVYSSSRADKPRGVYRRRSDGAGAEELLWSGTGHVHVESATPDGRAIILGVTNGGGVATLGGTGLGDLMLLPLDGDGTLEPLIQTPFNERGAQLSPDGRWLAYFSDESKRDEVYVRAFPSLEGKTQVSTGGGAEPMWSKRGDELFFRGEGQMMAVRVGPGAPLSLTVPRKLFADRYTSKGTQHAGYDVAHDGRFLMVRDTSAGQRAGGIPQTNFVVVLNWFSELKQKLPAR